MAQMADRIPVITNHALQGGPQTSSLVIRVVTALGLEWYLLFRPRGGKREGIFSWYPKWRAFDTVFGSLNVV
jgi:hypothetical protein